MKKILEIAVDSAEGAIIAQANGADRLELCSGLELGGITPSTGLMQQVRNAVSIPIFALIRPRSGDFLYSQAEFETIIVDVLEAKRQNINGVVIGFLTENGAIDIEKTKSICKLAYPMEVTFHRAFDLCKDPMAALEQIFEAGCNRLLTSGQASSALDGVDLISKLVLQAKRRIAILAGAGVRPNNVKEIIEQSGVFEVHTTAKAMVESGMKYRKSGVNMGNNSFNEFSIAAVDGEMVKKMREIIDKISLLSDIN